MKSAKWKQKRSGCGIGKTKQDNRGEVKSKVIKKVGLKIN